MSSLFYVNETLPGCPYLSFIMTTDTRSITRMIWLPSQIKNHNCLVELMLLIVLSPETQNAGKEKIYSAGAGFGEWVFHIGNEEA